MFATIEEEVQVLRSELQQFKGHKPAVAVYGDITIANYLLERLAQLGVRVKFCFTLHLTIIYGLI
jgi:hypothetical protein